MKNIVVLGQVFTPASHSQLTILTKSLPWITYRSYFPSPLEGGLKSDSGWGCMIRSAQMMIATGLMLGQCLPIHTDIYHLPSSSSESNHNHSHKNSKPTSLLSSPINTTSPANILTSNDHRTTTNTDTHIMTQDNHCNNQQPVFYTFAHIISLFFDDAKFPFSIHNIVQLGAEHGTAIGQWFGPNTISFAFHTLINKYPDSHVSCYLGNDSTIYEKQMMTLLAKEKPVLMLVPIRLGVDSLNPVYHDYIKQIFHFPHCIGIAGGKPNSAYYFVGVDGDRLLYLDPHYTRPVIEFKETHLHYTPKDLASYSCSSLSSIHIKSVDPSMVLGFICSSVQDYEAFKCLAIDSVAQGSTPLFSFAEEPIKFNDPIDIISDFDEDNLL